MHRNWWNNHKCCGFQRNHNNYSQWCNFSLLLLCLFILHLVIYLSYSVNFIHIKTYIVNAWLWIPISFWKTNKQKIIINTHSSHYLNSVNNVIFLSIVVCETFWACIISWKTSYFYIMIKIRSFWTSEGNILDSLQFLFLILYLQQ